MHICGTWVLEPRSGQCLKFSCDQHGSQETTTFKKKNMKAAIVKFRLLTRKLIIRGGTIFCTNISNALCRLYQIGKQQKPADIDNCTPSSHLYPKLHYTSKMASNSHTILQTSLNSNERALPPQGTGKHSCAGHLEAGSPLRIQGVQQRYHCKQISVENKRNIETLPLAATCATNTK